MEDYSIGKCMMGVNSLKFYMHIFLYGLAPQNFCFVLSIITQYSWNNQLIYCILLLSHLPIAMCITAYSPKMKCKDKPYSTKAMINVYYIRLKQMQKP